MITLALNDAWSVTLADDGRLVLYRLGREFGRYKSVHALWQSNRERFGKVDSDAFNRLFTLGRDHHDTPDEATPGEVKLGYWLHPEQLKPKKKGDQTIGN
ncbi:hypothetical protein EOA27_06035 [Mesorhizobium sp. M2A.F.Ca.ET.037.01.1.1]|uniref:hypothetical protein n=1 Tax=unclassified Mesorhizobium TaxID=325217 RepID=UPI000FCB22B9|nr:MULTISPECIES: hypothetical protein [unclassified Mesorhizobium]RUX21433.1 hypothetical protein EOA27_06035 [Mesorhizobium sp. M2A.F.Ca.ET.037.01.1.1]RUY12199.1 hypothetical protein EOA25_03975 [Mesorhizobium sp. M2A.F.Ca.ET.040.01.1.1]RWA90957.1 MAG: hypothetical protein EOQ31_12210 [Mesorhizobium sp.]TIV19798.1 MAG: hypothetical protein E5V95_07150 [Mesorhizobium sp.]